MKKLLFCYLINEPRTLHTLAIQPPVALSIHTPMTQLLSYAHKLLICFSSIPLHAIVRGTSRRVPTNDSTTHRQNSSVPHNKGILGSHGNPCDFVVRPHPTNDQSHLHTLKNPKKKKKYSIYNKIVYSSIDFSLSFSPVLPQTDHHLQCGSTLHAGTDSQRGQSSTPVRKEKSLNLLTRVPQDHSSDNMDLANAGLAEGSNFFIQMTS